MKQTTLSRNALRVRPQEEPTIVAKWYADAPWDRDKSDPPKHVAIIMDGNGRWANERGLPRAIGHRMGVEAVRRTIRAAIALKIEYLTLYSFSTENWSRPASEISDLMGLMKRFIRRDLAEMHKSGVRIMVIGTHENIEPELQAMIDEAVQVTSGNTTLKLTIAFNYGARAEIADAARKLAERAMNGEISLAEINSENLGSELDTAGTPDPDLLIRTSGEQRLSNFLLWQCAYTEFVFLEEYWPEFGEDLLRAAIDSFRTRERRYGGLQRHLSSA